MGKETGKGPNVLLSADTKGEFNAMVYPTVLVSSHHVRVSSYAIGCVRQNSRAADQADWKVAVDPGVLSFGFRIV